jgi:phosphoserine phosphatase RsbU/P
MSHTTTNVINDFLRPHLLARRERLESTKSRVTLPPGEVVRLLHEIDRALGQMDEETYGICDVCHTPIEEDRLLSNPLAQTCLEHMSEPQRQALQQDLDLAVRIQSGLLPRREVAFAGWEAGYRYEPLGAVSGDFCDLGSLDGRLFFLLGDVSGKGVSASLLMSNLTAIFRSLLTVEIQVTGLMERANKIFCEATRAPYYATLVCGFGAGDGQVELVNAGHCPPLVLHNGDAHQVDPTGLPAGLFADATYSSRRLHLEAGDALVLYTDGLSEACNAAGEEYGAERIAAAWRSSGGSPAEQIQICVDSLERFRGDAARNDDLTVAVIKRTS